MASIENRSRFIVTVRTRHDLARTFSHKREKDLAGRLEHLRSSGYKPQPARADDICAVRVRDNCRRTQCLCAASPQEAADLKLRVELERRSRLFVDYAGGRSVTLADRLARCLPEIAPRHKGFEVEWARRPARAAPLRRQCECKAVLATHNG